MGTTPYNKKRLFRLGITMAGAVSAGTYTAGVMDYLLEALDNWDRAKARNIALGVDHTDYDHSLPMHDIEIEVLSGASAGGITALLTTAAMQSDIPPAIPDNRNDEEVLSKNMLYDVWVNLSDDKMMPHLLETNDIETHGEVRSIANSTFVDDIATRVTEVRVQKPLRRRYISDDLDIFVTLSNVTGYAYRLGFRDAGDGKLRYYNTMIHSDIAHFRIGNPKAIREGQSEKGERKKEKRGRIPISFVGEGHNVKLVGDSAKATSAIPFGLSPRIIKRDTKYLEDNIYINLLYSQQDEQGPKESVELEDLPPKPKLQLSDDKERALIVDGGMLNNEPFEITQDILLRKVQKAEGKSGRDGSDDVPSLEPAIISSSKDYKYFKSTVIMIDPFPSEQKEEKKDARKYDLSVGSLAGKLIGTLRNQAAFKRENIERAFNPNDYSRFLVAPTRYGKPVGDFTTTENVRLEGSDAIACGSLGGFGGFLDKELRRHDFFMGRRNCQRFLRNHFCVPADIDEDHILYYTEEQKERFQILKRGRLMIPILPDVNAPHDQSEDYKTEEPVYDYPCLDASYLWKLKPLVNRRVKFILIHLKLIKKLKWHYRLIIKFLFRLLSGSISNWLICWVEKDLKNRHLIK